MKIKDLKTECRFFRGDIPCRPHKQKEVHCIDANGNDCEFYEKISEKILIIKLGAVGDVIRTTPLLTKFKNELPNAKIFWLTHSPKMVPELADDILKFNEASLTYLNSVEFDYIFNLDKDKEACALASSLKSKVKKGFILKDGIPYPADKNAETKFMTGLFDDINKANTKNYLEEIFDICGFKYSGEKYVLPKFSFDKTWDIDHSKKVVGLNTGCGGRWTSRLWPDEYWINLAKQLVENNYEVVFLGGEQEDKKNEHYSKSSGGKYFGHYDLTTFVNLMNKCDLIVTGVTMAMHITLGLNKKIVLFNNIFNPNEFELFGLGKIIQPDKECKCFFSPTCTNDEYKCMEHLLPEKVYSTIEELFSK